MTERHTTEGVERPLPPPGRRARPPGTPVQQAAVGAAGGAVLGAGVGMASAAIATGGFEAVVVSVAAVGGAIAGASVGAALGGLAAPGMVEDDRAATGDHGADGIGEEP
ncbi:MAG TPA: hypothetical protein VHL78_04940 [Actinomycetota bacterium]|nr:hypothetical protein [Actinomycetota bacterium]